MLHRGLHKTKTAAADAAGMAAGRAAPARPLGTQAAPPRASSADIVYTVVTSPGHALPGHVESPARISAVLDSLSAAGLRGGGPLAARARELPAARAASWEEVATVHAYARELQAKAASASTSAPLAVADLGDPDGVTFLAPSSLDDARRAAGASLALVDAVVEASRAAEGRGDAHGGGVPAGFGLLRPPGHHATPGTPLGYCLFNNAALAARHAQRRHDLARVLVVDFDVHNGNGTCEAFWEDPSVLVIDAHEESAIYPEPEFVAAGARATGGGAGEGYTINIPMPRELSACMHA
jgi:acetoin utilization deacetylase AcuC-like enzyme